MRPVFDPTGGPDVLVEKMIGTAYETVKRVYGHLPEIKRLDGVLEEIPNLAETTIENVIDEKLPEFLNEVGIKADAAVDSHLAEAIPPIMEDIQVKVNEVDTALESTKQAEAASLVNAGNSLASASTSASQAARAESEAGQAVLAKLAAEAARDASQLASGIFPDVAAGLVGTTSGKYFSVPSEEDGDVFLILYLNNDGEPEEKAKYPSAEIVKSLSAYVESVLDPTVLSSRYAAAFVDTPPPGVYSKVALGITKAGEVDIGNHRDVSSILSELMLPGYISDDDDFTRSDYVFVILDALNRIGLGITRSGELMIKGQSVDARLAYLEETPPINTLYEKWVLGLSTIAAFGDSLTAGGYPTILAGLIARAVHTGAVGGQNAQQIATRQGGYVNLLTVTGNTIPESGPVNIIASTQAPISNQGGGPILGMLYGVPGTVTATFDGSGKRITYQFTRSAAGTPVQIDPASPFVIDVGDNPFKINILWYGRNNFWTGRTDFDNAKAEVKAALAASIAYLKALDKKFIVMSVLTDNKPAEWKGTEKYLAITALNEELKALYPRNFIDIRSVLVRGYNPSLPQDVIDFEHDVTPTSLLSDTLHLNFRGNTLVAQTVKTNIIQRGW